MDRSQAYRIWKDSFVTLPSAEKLKIINRSMRRRAAAGACLSSTPIALSSYRDHYQSQFTNEFGIEPFVPSYDTNISAAVAITVASTYFSPSSVSDNILKSPAGKAPGISGISLRNYFIQSLMSLLQFYPTSSARTCHSLWFPHRGNALSYALFQRRVIILLSGGIGYRHRAMGGG